MSDDETLDDDFDMAAAMEEQNAINDKIGNNDTTLEEFSQATNTKKKNIDEDDARDVSAVYDVPVNVSAVLGRTSMQVSQLLKLSRGAVIELDRKVGEAIDIYVNNRLVARGEVVVVEDHLGITMTEIVKSDTAA